MRKIISDYDGIMIESEFAKAYGWYLACLSLKDDSEITPSLLESVKTKQNDAEQRLRQLVSARKEDLDIARSCAGGTTFDFGKRIWQRFYAGVPDREPSPTEIGWINNVLTPKREEIRDILIDWFAEPIEGNLQLFRELYKAMRETYHDEHPIGLVNQSKSKGLKKQFDLQREGKTIWSVFPELPKIFGDFSDAGFPYAECAGDGRIGYKGVAKDDVKKTAYTILCGKLGIRQDETISFEDTRDGVVAAKKAGVLCIGVRDKGSLQDLSEASVVINGTLDKLIDKIPVLVRGSPSEAVEEIAKYQRELYRQGVYN